MNEKTRLTGFMVTNFGAAIATDPTSPESIRSVSKKAYSMVGKTMQGIGNHPAKDTLLEDTHASLQQFVTELETNPLPVQDDKVAQANFDTRHHTWCINRMAAFTPPPHTHPEESFILTYGQAQMWINMTLKSLTYLGHPATSHAYRYFHLPVDYSKAVHPADFIGVPRPPGQVPWSQLNHDHYRNYQQKLRAAIAASSGGLLAPLDWEAQASIARPSF